MNFKRTNDIILHFVWIRSWSAKSMPEESDLRD